VKTSFKRAYNVYNYMTRNLVI